MAITKTKKYSLELAFNGEVYKTTTNDLEEALLEMKPDQLLTEIYVTARKRKEVAERRLSLQQGKRIFLDDMTRQVFVQNLLLN